MFLNTKLELKSLVATFYFLKKSYIYHHNVKLSIIDLKTENIRVIFTEHMLVYKHMKHIFTMLHSESEPKL